MKIFAKFGARRGFTLVELLIVISIIGLLTAIGLVAYSQASVNARNGKRKGDMEQLRAALVFYRTDNGTYPVTSSYSSMTTTVASYISSTNIVDPKNTGQYAYSYTGTAQTFQVCANLEPSATAYCLTNP